MKYTIETTSDTQPWGVNAVLVIDGETVGTLQLTYAQLHDLQARLAKAPLVPADFAAALVASCEAEPSSDEVARLREMWAAFDALPVATTRLLCEDRADRWETTLVDFLVYNAEYAGEIADALRAPGDSVSLGGGACPTVTVTVL